MGKLGRSKEEERKGMDQVRRGGGCGKCYREERETEKGRRWNGKVFLSYVRYLRMLVSFISAMI